MTKNVILVIGCTGQVGWELVRCAQPLGQVIAVGRGEQTEVDRSLDLSDPAAIRALVDELKPTVIINAAAYTAVDNAEKETDSADIINAQAVAVLAECAKAHNAVFVHYSTDYVFDGTASQPYLETDEVNPVSAYGRTKLAGEQAVAAVGGKYFIFRTAWVYGMRGKNFLRTMQRLANEYERLTVVADQKGAPTWSRMIAEATVQVVAQVISPLTQPDWENLSGVYHLTNAGETTWHGFAQAIIDQEEKSPEVAPITTADYPTPAARPAYSVLSNQKLADTFAVQLPDWHSALQLCLRSHDL